MAKRNLSNNDLIDAGFSQSQVIVLHDYFQEKVAPDYRNLVTTDQLDAKLDALGAQLRLEMAKNKAELKQDISNLELKMEKRFTEIEKKFSDLHRWNIGTIIAVGALMIAVMTYFNQR